MVMDKIKRGENFKGLDERESCFSDFCGKEWVNRGRKDKKL